MGYSVVLKTPISPAPIKSISSRVYSVFRRPVMVYAEKSETSMEIKQIVKDLSERWDKVEDKTSAILYGSGAIVLLWLASVIVGSVSNIPLLPKLMELVGLSYSAWFTYRYLIFKSSRQELVKDIEELKKKVSGDL